MVVATSSKVLAALVVGALTFTSGAAVARGTWTPPPDTITSVTGTVRSGFHVEYYDGAAAYLPTITEAIAECYEYYRTGERIRCRATVRASYRGLRDTKRAIRYARTY